MSEPIPFAWSELFAAESATDGTLELRVIKKSGRPFLFVPASSALAARALSLYPAQTGFAKFAKGILHAMFQARLPLPLEKTLASFASKAAFPKFLTGLVEGGADSLPSLAILAGNPRAEGRRFIILLFDGAGRPLCVVKAGIGDSARRLIRHEAAFLHSAPRGTPGLPSLRASFDADRISAFALDFVDGASPKPEAESELAKLLPAWLNREKRIRLGETQVWQALETAKSSDPSFRLLAEKVSGISIHPAIFHGDFAPWNIKVSPHDGSWKVVDWERGDVGGIPGWDWFHYVIQKGVLVQKETPEKLAQQLEQLLDDASFRNYAKAAGITGKEKVLVVAYLFYLTNVVRPSEGLATNQALLSLLAHRWRS